MGQPVDAAEPIIPRDRSREEASKANLDDATPPSGRVWTSGTLTYTTAGLAALFFWLLLGDFALFLRERSIAPVAQLFLKRQGTADATIGMLITSLPLLITLFLSPIVSYRSDRTRTRWGRRIPYLLLPTPLAVAAMVGLAFCPPLAGWLHNLLGGTFSLHTCVLLVFGFFWTTFEVAAITSIAVFGGLINDVVPSPVLGRFFGMFRAVSLMDAIIFNYFLLGHAEEHAFEMFLGVATVFGVGFTAMCLKVKEGQYPPVHALNDGPEQRRGFFQAAANYFRECYSNPYYLLFFLAVAIGQAGFTPLWTFLIFWAKQVGLTAGDYGKLHAFCTVGSLLLTVPLGYLADRFHPLRMAIVMMSLHFVVTTTAAVLVQGQRSFILGMVCQTLVSSSYLTVTASIGQRLLPKSRFTEFHSAGTLLTSLLGIIFSPSVGALLDRTDHNYRLTFVVCSCTAVVSVTLYVLVYRRFLALGGPDHYLAPGDTAADVVADAAAGIPARH